MVPPPVKSPLPEHCVSNSMVRVRFAETDLMGIVHHSAYLLYFEASRVEYMHRRGVRYLDWAERGIHLPVVSAEVRYRKTAQFHDRLLVESRLVELSRVKVVFDYRVLRDDQLVAEGSTTLACVGNDHRPRRIPPDVDAVLRGPETHPRPDDQV